MKKAKLIEKEREERREEKRRTAAAPAAESSRELKAKRSWIEARKNRKGRGREGDGIWREEVLDRSGNSEEVLVRGSFGKRWRRR